MTLTKSTFKVLNALRDEAVHTQRHIATATGLSLGTVNTAYRALVDAGLAENFSVTPAGFALQGRQRHHHGSRAVLSLRAAFL